MTENLKISLLLAKIESVYSTDPTPTGVANAIKVYNLKVVPLDQQDDERDFAQAGFSTEASIPYGSMVRITFSTDVVPASAAADAPPAVGPLWRACGCQETIVAATSVAYTGIATGMESATLYGYQGATLHKAVGSRGTVTLDCSGAEPRLNWEFTGLYRDPLDGALPTPTYPGQLSPVPLNKLNTDFTLNAVALVLHQMMFQLGNKVVLRDKPNYEAVDVDDRVLQGSVQVHKPALADFNAFTLAGSRGVVPTLVPLVLTHKLNAAPRSVALSLPKVQLQKPDYGADGNQRLLVATLMIRRNPGAQDFTVTYT